MHFQINRDNVRLNFPDIYGSISEHDKNGIKFSVASKFDCLCRVGGRPAGERPNISSVKSIMLLLPRNENMRKYASS